MAPEVRTVRLGWAPQPGPQDAFINCPVFEVVYGGARGGGKTDASLGDFMMHQARWGKAAKGLFIRRRQTDLVATIARAREIFDPAGARYTQQGAAFRFPSGAVIRFGYLERDEDAGRYQGQDFSRVYVEELTQFPRPSPVDRLKATLRSAAGAECGFRATCNPGGPGHGWVKARYIDSGAWDLMRQSYANPFSDGDLTLTRVFIPARLTDNARLMAADPLYVAKLQQSGSADLVRAWLEGDWNVVEGAFFDAWSNRNVLRPMRLPDHWTRFRSFDWGSARPFSVGWWALASEDLGTSQGRIPAGALIRFAEWYGSTGRSNEGMKLTAEEVAEGILKREQGLTLHGSVADPSIFAEDGGPSIAERMRRLGVVFQKADNTRVGGLGPLSGWDQMRARIRGDGERPLLYVFDTCRDFLRTVPTLRHDPVRPEDLDTDGEDHIADETRYACLSRKLRGAAPVPASNPIDLWRSTRRIEADWKAI